MLTSLDAAAFSGCRNLIDLFVAALDAVMTCRDLSMNLLESLPVGIFSDNALLERLLDHFSVLYLSLK